MSTSDKEQAAKLIEDVRSVLWNEWDPIGVRGITENGQSWPDDEYDSYPSPIASMIWHDKPPKDVADYLDWAVIENMGLTGGDRAANRRTHEKLALRLLALKAEIE
jgi:hypothetical protein